MSNCEIIKQVQMCHNVTQLIDVAEKYATQIEVKYGETDIYGTAYEIWKQASIARKTFGQFFTPPMLRQDIATTLPASVIWKCCDIAGAGSGRLLCDVSISCVDRFGVELDPNLTSLLHRRGVKHLTKSGLDIVRSDIPFAPNLWISNPPFRWSSQEVYTRSGGNIAALLSVHIINLAVEEDYIVLVLPINALTGERETGFDVLRKKLVESTQLVKIFEYHDVTFLNTKIRSCVVVCKKISGSNNRQTTFEIEKVTPSLRQSIIVDTNSLISNRLNYDTYDVDISLVAGEVLCFDDVILKTSIHYSHVVKQQACISLHNCSRPNECKTATRVGGGYTMEEAEQYLLTSPHALSVYKKFNNPGIKYNNTPLKFIRTHLVFPVKT